MQEPGDKRGKMAFNLLKGDVLARYLESMWQIHKVEKYRPKIHCPTPFHTILALYPGKYNRGA